MALSFDILGLGYEEFFISLLNLFNLQVKSIHNTIADINAFNLHEERIEKLKKFIASISEINQRHNKMRVRDKYTLRNES